MNAMIMRMSHFAAMLLLASGIAVSIGTFQPQSAAAWTNCSYRIGTPYKSESGSIWATSSTVCPSSSPVTWTYADVSIHRQNHSYSLGYGEANGGKAAYAVAHGPCPASANYYAHTSHQYAEPGEYHAPWYGNSAYRYISC